MPSDDLVRISSAEIVIPNRLRLVVPAFRIRRGEIAILIGPNGSGKSTLARYICRIPGAETITAATEQRPSPPAVMVWQTLNLFPLTVLRNVSIVKGQDFEVALQHFNLWMLRDTRADEISGGEQQKLAIARSIVSGPDMLILDEPSSSLDSRSIYNLVRVVGAFVGLEQGNDLPFLTQLSGEAEGRKRAALIISHDLRLVRALGRFAEVRLFSLGESQERSSAETEFRLNAGAEGVGYTLEHVHSSPPDLYTADFFGLPNILGFTSSVGDFRGATDFCSRYRDDVVGWLILRDEAIRVHSTRPEGANWPATVVGFEHLGAQKRAKFAVEGMFGSYEVTAPADTASGLSLGQSVFVSYHLDGACQVVRP